MLDTLRHHCRRIILEMILDPDIPDEDRGWRINSAEGVGTCFAAALDLGMARLGDGLSPADGFTFGDIAWIVEGVEELICEEEQRAHADLDAMSAHRRIQLGRELRQLQSARPEAPIDPETFTWVDKGWEPRGPELPF